MRKRSLSVACERAAQLEHMSQKFEGVPPEHETENESDEEENEEAPENVDSDWTESDYKSLLEHLRSVVPQKDKKNFQITLKKIDWERVAFEGRTADEVKTVTLNLMKGIRKYRTLKEVIEDIPLQSRKTCPIGKPKNPPSAYNLFVKAKFQYYKEKHPELPMRALFKVLHHEYTGLSQKKKDKYDSMAAEGKEVYKQKMEQYYKDNPNISGKKSHVTKKVAKTANVITPFDLFRQDMLNKNEDTNISNLRSQWNSLQVKEKLKYIQKAFTSQTENNAKPLKLNKEEQELMEHIKGKPLPIAGSLSEYYLKNYADVSKSSSVIKWRKDQLLQFKSLPKLRKLELEIEYRQAKQDYITSYENYIANLTDKKEQLAQIDLLKSFIQKRLDKDDRQQLPDDNRPFSSMIHATQLENEMMELPIAESTTLVVKTKKAKKAASEKESIAAESPQQKALKSILKSPGKASKVAKDKTAEFVEPAAPPKSKRKHSISENESDSNSEKRTKHSIVRVPIVEPTVNNSSSQVNGTKNASFSKPNEPVRPPATILEFYKERYYLGKADKCAESFKKLSTTRKQALRKEMRDAQKKYFKELQKFLKHVPQQNIKKYLNKLKQVQIDFSLHDQPLKEDSVAKPTPKQEPQTSSGSDSDSDSDSGDENSEDEKTQNEVISSCKAIKVHRIMQSVRKTTAWIIPSGMRIARMSAGEMGSGAGKGGGGGGSIRDAGGSFGKMEVAHEEEYFYKQRQEQLAKLKQQAINQEDFHSESIKHHEEAIARHKKAMEQLKKK
uniref:ATP synthase F1 subunit epsilon n=1 Tax=Anopheles minimus TaxID=112268 RepID=A0A182VUC4_9DIPT